MLCVDSPLALFTSKPDLVTSQNASSGTVNTILKRLYPTEYGKNKCVRFSQSCHGTFANSLSRLFVPSYAPPFSSTAAMARSSARWSSLAQSSVYVLRPSQQRSMLHSRKHSSLTCFFVQQLSFGYLVDRYGRKFGMLAASAIMMCVPSLAAAPRQDG